jgi:hypothetical protein
MTSLTLKTVPKLIELRPGVTNPALWLPERPPKNQWEKIRLCVLNRANYTCCFCGHRATKWMNIHHLKDGTDNKLPNLRTNCVACHAVLHFGLNLGLGILEIWESKLSQVEIVRRTREAVAKGKSLAQIKKTLLLKKGPYPPKSVEYANDLIEKMGDSARAYLEKPLCAVFTGLKRWQIENDDQT